MTKLSFVKVAGRLMPGDDDAKVALDKIAAGREVIVEIKTARHPKQHRTFFALLDVLVDGSSFSSKEAALTAIKVAIGECDPVISADGEVVYVTRSIAFESCDQTRFSEIFDRTLEVICDRWLIGADKEELRNRVLDIVEDKRAASLGTRVRRAA